MAGKVTKPVRKTTRKNKVKKKKDFTLSLVKRRLNAIIEIQLSDPNLISYKMELIKLDLYPQLLSHWEQYPEIAELLEMMRAIREARYEETLLSDVTQKGPINLLFYGKCCLNYVERQHVIKLEADNDDTDDLGVIEVEYTEPEEGEEDDNLNF